MLERKNPGSKVAAAYFMIMRKSWVPDNDQEKLREVFSCAEKTWKEELDKLDRGLVFKGKDKDRDKKKDGEVEVPSDKFQLEVLCKYCDYYGLCKPNVNEVSDSTEDEND
jgi:hypothetical protein